jgi:hypothetical protein
VKKGDLVYTADGTLGFVSAVYHPSSGDATDGWAAVDVPGVDGPVYFGAQDLQTRDETVPSVLLRTTYNEATDEAHRREPDAIASGAAQHDETPPLEVGRPEVPEDVEEAGSGRTSSAPGRPPLPDAVRDWPAQEDDQRALGIPPL